MTGALTDHVRYRELIAGSVDTRLTADEAAELERHLASCAVCRAERSAMLADHSWLATPMRVAPADPRVELAVMRRAAGARGPAAQLRGAVATLVILAVVVAIGVILGNQDTIIGPSTSPLPSPDVPTFSAAAPSPGPSGLGTPSPAPSPRPSTPPSVQRVGDELVIWPAPPETFAAGAPFHLTGGYCLELVDLERLGWSGVTESEAYAIGIDPGTRVDFYIDGIPVASQRETLPPRARCIVEVHSVANLPTGLAEGQHHLEAHWFLAGRPDIVREADIAFR